MLYRLEMYNVFESMLIRIYMVHEIPQVLLFATNSINY